MFSCYAICIIVVPFDSLASLYACMALQCLDRSEQLAVIILYSVLLSILQSCTKGLHHIPSRCFEQAS